MKTKRFAVRIQEGARPILRIVEAENTDEAALQVINQLDADGDRLLGAKIAVWVHGTLQKNSSPLFIKSIKPFEVTPDSHLIQTIKEEARRAKWLETQALAKKEKERKLFRFEEPYQQWLGDHAAEGESEFFALPEDLRRECIELRDRLRHVSPGQMTDVQARFAGVVSGFMDLYRFEMQSIQENLVATLDVIHHHHAGGAMNASGNKTSQRDRLVGLLGSSASSNSGH